MARKQVLKSVSSMDTNQGTEISLSVTKTGTANTGTVAPFLGNIDISGNDTAYNFQVALVSVSTDPGE